MCSYDPLFSPLLHTRSRRYIFISSVSILKSSHPRHAHLFHHISATRHPLFFVFFSSYSISPHFLICAHSHFNQCTLFQIESHRSHTFMFVFFFFHRQRPQTLQDYLIPASYYSITLPTPFSPLIYNHSKNTIVIFPQNEPNTSSLL